ncbi:MAG: tetratricopeptide repeat protein [Bacteroidia bacterium]
MKKDLYNKIFAPSSCLTQQLLIGYLKGTLTEHETHKAEEHLIDCELCSEALDGLILINNENVLAGVTADVKKVAHGKENKRRVAPFGIWMAAAASVAIIIASIIGLKFITTADDNQLAMKSPYLSDSLMRKSTAAEETIKTEAPKIKEEDNNDVEQEISDLIKPPSPPQTESMHEVSEINVEEKPIDDNVKKDENKIAIVENKSIRSENNTSDAVFNEEQSTRQSAIRAGGRQTQTQTLSKSNAPAAANPVMVADHNLVTFIHDLKIINYSEKVINETLLEPEIKHTEAQFASPEEKQKQVSVDKAIITSYKEKVTPALKAYSDKNYTASITLSNNLLKENPSDINALFYSGMSYYYLNNYTEATKLFSVLSQNNDNIFYEEAIFYLAVCQLNLNNKTKARNLFKEVVELNSFYKARALEQLNNLNY